MKRYDCVVVGGGCAGIFITHRLARLGLRVLLLDKEQRLATGPSIRNGAYIHAGGYHAASIRDPEEARGVSRSCITGADYFRTQFPEAIVAHGLPVNLLLRNPDRVDSVIQRLRDCGVWHRVSSKAELALRYPDLDTGQIALAMEVQDFHVNFRMIFQRLITESQAWGADIQTGVHLEYDGKARTALVSRDGSREDIELSRVVYSTGFGTADLVRQNAHRFSQSPSVRLWRSHVLNLPHMDGVGFMFIDPGDVSITPQGTHTLVCQAKEEALIDGTSYAQDRETVQKMIKSLVRVMPNLKNLTSEIRSHACIKVSLDRTGTFERNVEYSFDRVSQSEWIALPGKASCAPVLADAVAQAIFREDDADKIGIRPGASLVSA